MMDELEPDMTDDAGESILDQLDKATAQAMLDKVKSGEASAQDFEAVRKYLDHKGYRGPSQATLKKVGAKKDPRLDLGNLTEDVIATFS